MLWVGTDRLGSISYNCCLPCPLLLASSGCWAAASSICDGTCCLSYPSAPASRCISTNWSSQTRTLPMRSAWTICAECSWVVCPRSCPLVVVYLICRWIEVQWILRILWWKQGEYERVVIWEHLGSEHRRKALIWGLLGCRNTGVDLRLCIWVYMRLLYLPETAHCLASYHAHIPYSPCYCLVPG